MKKITLYPTMRSKNNFVITNQEEKVILPKIRNIEVINLERF